VGIGYDELMARRRVDATHEYDAERVMLYAVGVGFGMDPTNVHQLRFCTEPGLTPVPSFVTVAAWDIRFKLELGIEWSKLLHAAQHIRLLGPIPVVGRIRASTHFTGAYHKPGRGTLLLEQTVIHDASTGAPIAQLDGVSLARDFYVDGAPEGAPQAPPNMPTRPPDHMTDSYTSPQVALIYRMLGGRSDIHWDPTSARAQGFDRPIMHGLCTYGHACHAILRASCDYQPERLSAMGARFSAPVYPGERLQTALWYEGAHVRFETRAAERNVVVLSEGSATLHQ
jgi:acyl dehydratase